MAVLKFLRLISKACESELSLLLLSLLLFLVLDLYSLGLSKVSFILLTTSLSSKV